MLALNVLAPTSRSSIGQDERETHRKDALMRHSLLYIKPKKSSWKGGGETRNDFYDCNPLDPFILLSSGLYTSISST